jgi:hypothetical protein
MREKIGFGKTSTGVRITCDMPDDAPTGTGTVAPCVDFVSSSFVSVGRAQAAGAGWGRTPIKRIRDWENLGHGSDGRRLIDVCPAHNRAIEADYPSIAGDRATAKATARREIKAAAKSARDLVRTEKKATKARERADKREMAKLARSQARDAARLEKKQIKATQDALRDPQALRFASQRAQQSAT